MVAERRVNAKNEVFGAPLLLIGEAVEHHRERAEDFDIVLVCKRHALAMSWLQDT